MTSNGEQRHIMNNEQEYTRDELAQMLVESANIIWGQFKMAGNKLLTDWGCYDAFGRIVKLAAIYPLAALGAVLGIVMVFLPLTILFAFGLSTMAMTFTGFLMLEGTLLTVASVLLFGCLGGLLVVFLFFSVITITCYYGFVHIYDFYTESNSKTALRQFLSRERTQNESPRQ